MNHRNSFRKLTRSSSHRQSLFRNLITQLILHKRIETTVPKAKELKRIADKMITLGKKQSLHARRQAMAYLQPISRQANSVSDDRTAYKKKDTAVHILFTELAPSFDGREGGYTRIIRGRKNPAGKRLDARRAGDNAEMAIVEFVSGPVEKKAKKVRRVTRKSAAAEKTPTKAAEVEAASESKSE